MKVRDNSTKLSRSGRWHLPTCMVLIQPSLVLTTKESAIQVYGHVHPVLQLRGCICTSLLSLWMPHVFNFCFEFPSPSRLTLTYGVFGCSHHFGLFLLWPDRDFMRGNLALAMFCMLFGFPYCIFLYFLYVVCLPTIVFWASANARSVLLCATLCSDYLLQMWWSYQHSAKHKPIELNST
jgi:hypothetical protein